MGTSLIRNFVLFGATGDLAARYLVPALVRLAVADHLPDGFRLIGVSREPWDVGTYRRHLLERTHVGDARERAALEAMAAGAGYGGVDLRSRDDMVRELGWLRDPFVAYLALPPAIFAATIEGLGALAPPPGSRVVVEKPFGEGLESARALNRLLHRCFPEEAVFRLDHFLGKQTVQNVLALRFANRIFEPVWNAYHVERVEIIWDETLTVAGRAGFYDATGAVRDMVQNHLLQLLALVAMEPVAVMDARSLRDRKVDVLQAVRRLSPEEVARRTTRGRYGSGTIDGTSVRAYVDEEGVDPGRETETFAEVTLAIDNWRWAGVPFVLRTGKALARDRREVAIHFKPVPHVSFGTRAPQANVLRLDLDPDRIALGMMVKAAGDLFELEPIALDARLASTDLPAYAWLLLDVLQGTSTLSIRDDEAEELWRIVEPILEAWQAGAVPLQEYAAGTDLPLGEVL